MNTRLSKQSIPPEAAQIMKRMVSMPPKPHEDMKLRKSKPKAGKSPKGGAPQSKNGRKK